MKTIILKLFILAVIIGVEMFLVKFELMPGDFLPLNVADTYNTGKTGVNIMDFIQCTLFGVMLSINFFNLVAFVCLVEPVRKLFTWKIFFVVLLLFICGYAYYISRLHYEMKVLLAMAGLTGLFSLIYGSVIYSCAKFRFR